MKEIIKRLGRLGISSLLPVFQMLARKVTLYRVQHNGCVPISIYPLCTQIGGAYPCVELLVTDKSGKRFALKKRDVADQGWQGLYHIPGTVIHIDDSWYMVLKRLATEMYGHHRARFTSLILTPIGTTIYFERERSSNCMTSVFSTRAVDSLDELDGEWKWSDELKEEQIVDHHRKTIRWASDPQRLPFYPQVDRV